MAKRRVLTPQDRADVPLAQVVNFGPVTLAEFEAMGLKTMRDLRNMGLESAFRLWVQFFPERLNLNAVIGLITALDGQVWTKASGEQKRLARELVNLLREEQGLPPVQKKVKRRSRK